MKMSIIHGGEFHEFLQLHQVGSKIKEFKNNFKLRIAELNFVQKCLNALNK